jgi:diaminohydroxyphosphoribosylaminopyrimidine deaminase/5-amino-6-(5-phosphoribosylamino)uracil reductase
MNLSKQELYMQRCLELASLGLGAVAPNPMVGCVIVKEGEIISEGYHQQFGGLHAEANAMRLLTDEELNGATMYVSLEPCCHHGKTPPCADLIIDKKIKEVIIGSLDTNPLVSGQGVEKLKNAGVQVVTGVLEKQCRELNKRFYTFHEKKRPYIILKWAKTQDDFISRWPLPENKEDNWITSSESKKKVHQWRSEEQAILIGYNTLVNDNPALTTRLVMGKNPIRMVLCRDIPYLQDYKMFNNESKTILFNTVKDDNFHSVTFVKVDWKQKIEQVMEYCHSHGISSLIIEGGTNTIYQFLNANLWDEARIFINPDLKFTHGILAPEFDLSGIEAETSGTDLLYIKHNTL